MTDMAQGLFPVFSVRSAAEFALLSLLRRTNLLHQVTLVIHTLFSYSTTRRLALSNVLTVIVLLLS